MFSHTIIRNKIRASYKIKTLIYYAIFSIPSLYYGLPSFTLNVHIKYYIGAIIISLLFIILQYKEYKPYFNKELYSFLPSISKPQYVISSTSLIISPLVEELLYRANLPSSYILIECLFSGILFSFAHYINPSTREQFTYKNYVTLLILGIVWYLSYKLSGSIMPSIIGHLLYNTPALIILNIKYFNTLKQERIYNV